MLRWGGAEPRRIGRTIEAYCAAWAARDRDLWLATFTDDPTQEDPIGDGVWHGRDQIGAFFDAEVAGSASVVEAGGSFVIPAGAVRLLRNAADGPLVTLTAARPGATARVDDQEPVPVPWAA